MGLILALLLTLPLPVADAEARGHWHEEQVWESLVPRSPNSGGNLEEDQYGPAAREGREVGKPSQAGSGTRAAHSFLPSVEQWTRLLVLSGFPLDVIPDALAVMECESGGDPSAYNRSSGASGLFQFIPSTWRAFGEGDPFDPGSNIAAAYRLWQHGHPRAGAAPNWGHWECQPDGTIWPF